jgi:hypothetical protein
MEYILYGFYYFSRIEKLCLYRPKAIYDVVIWITDLYLAYLIYF